MGRKRKSSGGGASTKKSETSNSKRTEESSRANTENENPTDPIDVDDPIQESPEKSPKEDNITPVANSLRRSQRLQSLEGSLGGLSISAKPVASPSNRAGKGKEPQDPQLVITSPVSSEENVQEEEQGQRASKRPALSKSYVQGEEPSGEKGSDVLRDEKLHKKLDYLVAAVDEFRQTFARRPNESTSSVPNYESLYNESQNQLRDLMENIWKVEKELEYVKGKADAYEAMRDPSRDVFLLSDAGQHVEAGRLSAQFVRSSVLAIGPASGSAPASASNPAPVSTSTPASGSATVSASNPAPASGSAPASTSAPPNGDGEAKKKKKKKKTKS